MREWVLSEIEHRLASLEEGPDGYRQSAVYERKEAERLFFNLEKSLNPARKND